MDDAVSGFHGIAISRLAVQVITKAYLQKRDDIRPLQAEIVRYVQERVDLAYGQGLVNLSEGRLKPTLSPNEAVGNYMDRVVRSDLRQFMQANGIVPTREGPIRIIGREYGNDLTYTVPDARAGSVLIDWTLAPKTSRTRQIRGFFASDGRFEAAVIVRPRQLGASHTYAIRGRGTDMPQPYTPYIPKNVGEILDLLAWMTLYAPKFEDPLGYFVGQNIDTEFFALNEGFKLIRRKLGEDRYQELLVLSHRMRAHFEADPEDKTEEGLRGREVIYQIEDMLKARKARKSKDG